MNQHKPLVTAHTLEVPLAEPHEKLADSLDILKSLQAGGRRVFQSKEFGRTLPARGHERLGYLGEP